MNIHSFFKNSQIVQKIVSPKAKQKIAPPLNGMNAIFNINQPVLRKPAEIPLIVRSTSVINSSDGSS